MFGLSFLSPLFLLGALAVSIPIALHLFRRKTDAVVEFPAVRLLQKAPVERQRRRRLRELILLALRVSALVLLAVAFARPYIDRASGVVPAPTTVVALDTSFSLSAPRQFDAARAAARRAIEETPPTHTVALVTFADAATVTVPATTDRGAAVAAIDRAAPAPGGTRFRSALARAAEAASAGQGRIVVVTDLQQVGWDAADEGAVPDGLSVEVIEIPPPAGNLAVTSVRRDEQGVVVAVHNFGSRPHRAPVTMAVDGRTIASASVDLAPQAAAEVTLRGAIPASGGAEVRIEDPDGYQTDNVRFLALDPPSAVRVVVITSESPDSSNAGLYVERALMAAEGGRAFDVEVREGRDWSAAVPSQDPPGAIVLLGTSSLDRGGRERVAGYLKDGGSVLLALGPDVDLATLADTVGMSLPVAPELVEAGERPATLVAVDGRHPIFRPFLGPSGALGDIQVARYRHLPDAEARTVLARFSGGATAFTEQPVGQGRLLVFTSDLDNRWNRFPLNPAFVPWAIETARYLTQGRGSTASYTLPDVPGDVPPIPGVHARADASGQSRRVSVNVDIRESNPARTTADEFAQSVTRLHEVPAAVARTVAREQEDRQRLWQVGLALMVLALAVEGAIGRKAA
jgi:hypothetical protein